jgi:hypothetical protein
MATLLSKNKHMDHRFVDFFTLLDHLINDPWGNQKQEAASRDALDQATFLLPLASSYPRALCDLWFELGFTLDQPETINARARKLVASNTARRVREYSKRAVLFMVESLTNVVILHIGYDDSVKEKPSKDLCGLYLKGNKKKRASETPAPAEDNKESKKKKGDKKEKDDKK